MINTVVIILTFLIIKIYTKLIILMSRPVKNTILQGVKQPLPMRREGAFAAAPARGLPGTPRSRAQGVSRASPGAARTHSWLAPFLLFDYNETKYVLPETARLKNADSPGGKRKHMLKNCECHVNEEQILKDWEALHQIPEVGFQEVKTSAYLRKRLEELGFCVESIAGTGLLARLDGAEEGPAVGLRADIDALSFPNEDGSVFYKHACGHDAHMAMVLGAGEAIIRRGIRKGRLYLLFQPAEETGGGAAKVLECGLPHMDALFGMHLRPGAETGLGKAAAKLIHQSSIHMNVQFRGKAAHGARPFLGHNALSAAAYTVVKIDELKLDTDMSWSAKATNCDCHGNLGNVIPENCTLVLDIRAFTNELGDRLIEEALKIINAGCEKFGCSMTYEMTRTYAGEFDEAVAEKAKEAIEEVYGVCEEPIYTLGGEDFHIYYVVGKIPTAYMGLGAALEPGLHARDMEFDHSCMKDGAEIFYRAAAKYIEIG